MTKDLHNFLRATGINADTETLTQAELVFELRAITGKYQPLASIQHDLQEIALAEQQQDQNQDVEEVAAGGDS